MQCIGANAIDDDHEDATKDSFGYNSNENDEPWAKPAGVWTWHKNRSSSDLQYVVNHDNTVMREVNYVRPTAKNAKTANAVFLELPFSIPVETDR